VLLRVKEMQNVARANFELPSGAAPILRAAGEIMQINQLFDVFDIAVKADDSRGFINKHEGDCA
jgi:hypothetical protein